MFYSKSYRLLLVKHLSLPNVYAFQRRNISYNVDLLAKILGFKSSTATRTFLQEHAYLIDVDAGAVSESVRYLNQIGITTKSIREQPKILSNRLTILKNRHEILRECGCSNVNMYHLLHYYRILRKSETDLKFLGIIDNDINLQERLAHRLNMELHRCSSDADLKTIRLHFLRLFLVRNGFMTATEFDGAPSMFNIRRNSYQSTEKLLKFLTQQLDIPKHRILEYKQALRADPDNLEQLLKIKLTGVDRGANMKDFLKNYPAVMVLSANAVKQTLTNLKKFGIRDEIITQRKEDLVELLKLDPRVLHHRLEELKKNFQFSTMKFHPLYLQLILNYHTAEHRIRELAAMDRKCFTFKSMIGPLLDFQKFSERDNDRHLRRDCVLFINQKLKMDAEKVTLAMLRHPHWEHIPLFDVENTIDTLKKEGFKLEDIRANIHIVLYNSEVIVNRLRKFSSEGEQFEGYSWAALPKSVQLKLILYDIEVATHFNGEGVWLDRKKDGWNR